MSSQTTPVGARNRLALGAMMLLSLLAFVRYRSISHGRTFHFDEWYWVLLRNDFSRHALLDNHNGHLSVIPGFIFVSLFNTIGLSRYWIYLSIGFLTHIALAWLLYAMFSKKFGRTFGVCIAAATLFLGSGAQNYLWSFQIGFMFSAIGYLLGRLALESSAKSKRIALFFSLFLALGSSGLGVPITAALGFEALLRRWRLRDLWPFVSTGFAYGLWYLAYGRSDANSDYAHLIPKYARDSASAVVAGIFDFTLDWGYLVLGILAGLVIVRLFRLRKVTAPTAGALVFLSLFWSLTCLSRAQYWDVGAGRYVYAAFVAFLIILWDLLPTTRANWLRLGALLLVPITVWASWSRMDSEALFYKVWGQSVAAELLALDLHRTTAPFDYYPDKVRAPNVYAAAYFTATDRLGSSPAVRPSALPGLIKEARIEFDRVSLELGDIAVRIYETESSSCDGLMTSASRTRLRLNSGVQDFNAITQDITVGFKRYGTRRSDTFQITIPKGSTAQVTVRRDSLKRDWTLVQLNQGGGLCRSVTQN